MSNFVELILYRLAHIGDIPICNGIAARAPQIFGFCFPLCYRCTFIVLIFLLTLYICYKYKKQFNIWLLIFCLIPMIIDGCLQTFWGIESTNLKRALTGGLFGFALAAIVTRVYMYIDERL